MNFAIIFGVSILYLIINGFQSSFKFCTALETNSFITSNLPEATQNQ